MNAEVKPINWTPAMVSVLRIRIAMAERFGYFINLPTGQTVSVDYAKHVLSCLDDKAHPDTTSERAAT